MKTPDDDREHLWDLIKDIRFAMFTTRHAQGHLHSRPMTTQNGKIDEGSSLWFFMSRSGEPVADLQREPMVNVGYADTGKDSYVSVSGRAAVVEDAAMKKALWGTINQAWFPGGVGDPDLALVRVQIDHAEIWDVRDNKLTQLLKMATAAMTGKPPDMGEHTTVKM